MGILDNPKNKAARAVFDALSAERPVPLSEIVAATGMRVSTVRRLLAVLAREELVEQEQEPPRAWRLRRAADDPAPLPEGWVEGGWVDETGIHPPLRRTPAPRPAFEVGARVVRAAEPDGPVGVVLKTVSGASVVGGVAHVSFEGMSALWLPVDQLAPAPAAGPVVCRRCVYLEPTDHTCDEGQQQRFRVEHGGRL